MTDDRDELIDRMRTALAPLPSVAPASIARVLAATAGRVPRERSAWERLTDWFGTPTVSLAGLGAVAATALLIGFVARGMVASRSGEVATATAGVSGRVLGTSSDADAPRTGTTPTLAAGASSGRVAVQFVLDDPAASSVSVIGDFNGWLPTAAPMQRVERGQAWAAVVLVPPGRHEYAFLVDGTRWVADPRAPRAADADFGKPGSVLMVQAP